jgi:hypothetical protein
MASRKTGKNPKHATAYTTQEKMREAEQEAVAQEEASLIRQIVQRTVVETLDKIGPLQNPPNQAMYVAPSPAMAGAVAPSPASSDLLEEMPKILDNYRSAMYETRDRLNKLLAEQSQLPPTCERHISMSADLTFMAQELVGIQKSIRQMVMGLTGKVA